MTWRLSTDSNITFPTRAKGRSYIKENKAALMQKYGDWPRLVPIPEAPITMVAGSQSEGDISPKKLKGNIPLQDVLEILEDLYKITRQHSVISLYKEAMLNREERHSR